jgi:hypothetical protein
MLYVYFDTFESTSTLLITQLVSVKCTIEPFAMTAVKPDNDDDDNNDDGDDDNNV